MSDAAQRLADELQKVAAAFDARLPQRLQALEALWQAFETGEPDSAEPLRRELHRLRGTAASYGYQALSHCLRNAEERLTRLDQANPDGRAALQSDMREAFTRRWERDTPLI